MTDIRERYTKAVAAHVDAKAAVASLQTRIDAAQAEANEKRILAAGADEVNEAEIDARAEAIETGVQRPEIGLVSADKLTEAEHVAEALVKRLKAKQTEAANARNGAAGEVADLRKQLHRAHVFKDGIQAGKIPFEALADKTLGEVLVSFLAAKGWNPSRLRDESETVEAAGQIFGGDSGAIRFSNFIRELVAEPKRATMDDAKVRLADEMGLQKPL